jgi:hypothetical protein
MPERFISFDLLAFESREMAADFIGRKHASYFRDKSRKLPGESRMLRGGAGEVHQFLSDGIVKRRLKPKALSDGSSRFALLDPNLMMSARRENPCGSFRLRYKPRKHASGPFILFRGVVVGPAAAD